ncbi:MAG: CRISPR-associated endonuclease Cas2 [Desulfobaccales bacterium]|jgi:CRISPR-associated protein Cas2
MMDEMEEPAAEFDEQDLIPISALEHYAYCLRQAALIHVEMVWDENLYTQRGRFVHEIVDRRRRLRRMAQQCKNFGQRVQKSVFECEVNEMQFEGLIRALVKIIHKEDDSLRIYRLTEPLEKNVRVFGWDKKVDFSQPLLV